MGVDSYLVRLVEMLIGDKDFVTEIKDVDVYGLPDRAMSDGGRAHVTWSLNLDQRGYGVKDLSIAIKHVMATWTRSDESGPTLTEAPESVDSNEEGWKLEDYVLDRSLPCSLVPHSVEVHLRERRIVVNF